MGWEVVAWGVVVGRVDPERAKSCVRPIAVVSE